MKSDQSFCLGGRHYSRTLNEIIDKKVNSQTKKLVKVIKGSCSVCGHTKSQISAK